MASPVEIQTFEFKSRLNLVPVTWETLKDNGLKNLLANHGYASNEYIPYGKTEMERFEFFLPNLPSAQYHHAFIGDYIVFAGLLNVYVMTAEEFTASDATRIF